jgi:hypothetical protein
LPERIGISLFSTPAVGAAAGFSVGRMASHGFVFESLDVALQGGMSGMPRSAELKGGDFLRFDEAAHTLWRLAAERLTNRGETFDQVLRQWEILVHHSFCQQIRWLNGTDVKIRLQHLFADRIVGILVKTSGKELLLMESQGFRRGRPPKEGEGKRASFNTRLRASLKQDIEADAKAAGRSLSEQIETVLERSRQNADAMVLAYGPDVAGLTFLIAEVLRSIAPRGVDFDDEASVGATAAALGDLFRRLRAPDDGTPPPEKDCPEKVVRAMLCEFAYTGAEYGHGAEESPRSRWAEAKRRLFGNFIAQRLNRYREAVTKELLAQPPREVAKPKPEDAASWERAAANLKTEQKE